MRQRVPLLRDLPPEVSVLTAISFFVALGFGILIPAIPIFARSFGVSALAASAVISVFALVRLVTSPLAGWLTDRIGERTTLSSGIALVAGSSVIAGLSQTYEQLIVLRGIGGLGSSMFTVSAQALLLRVVDAPSRGRASAAYQGGFLLGGVAGPAVGGLVLAWSLRAPFFVYAASLTVAALVGAVFLSSSRLREREQAVEAAEGGTSAGGWQELREALRSRAYQASLTTNLSTGLVFFGLRAALVPLFVVEGLRQQASLAGLAFLLAAGVQAILLFPAGRMADTVGRRRSMLIGTSLAAAGMAVLTLSDLVTNGPNASMTPGIALFLIAMTVMGAGTAYLSSAPAAVVGDVMGGRRGGPVIAVFQMTSDLGGVIGPLLAGVLVDALDYDWAFAVGTAVGIIAILMVARMPETLKKPAAA